MRPYVAVVGSGIADDDLLQRAYEVGRLLGERKAILLSGGYGGVMEASCRGAKEAGGTSVGILPSIDKREANVYMDVVIPTGMGEMRNALIVRAADAVIAVGGEYGTLSEVAFALRIGKYVVGLDTWELAKGGTRVDAFPIARSPQEAVDLALATCQASGRADDA